MKLLLSALAYGLVTWALFGNPLQPVALATIWSDRLGVPNWWIIAVLIVAASIPVFARSLSNPIIPVLRPTVFVILAVLLPTVIVGLYADSIRRTAVIRLGADETEEHSFFVSIREAPAEFQSFLHTAALKGCVPYAWSYRTLAFYKLPPDVGVNVLPQRWIKQCGIVRNRQPLTTEQP